MQCQLQLQLPEQHAQLSGAKIAATMNTSSCNNKNKSDNQKNEGSNSGSNDRDNNGNINGNNKIYNKNIDHNNSNIQRPA